MHAFLALVESRNCHLWFCYLIYGSCWKIYHQWWDFWWGIYSFKLFEKIWTSLLLPQFLIIIQNFWKHLHTNLLYVKAVDVLNFVSSIWYSFCYQFESVNSQYFHGLQNILAIHIIIMSLSFLLYPLISSYASVLYIPASHYLVWLFFKVWYKIQGKFFILKPTAHIYK